MFRPVVFLTLLFVSGTLFPQGGHLKEQAGHPQMLHSSWDSLLRTHVRDDGRADYKGFLENRDKLQAYLEALAQTPPADHWTREARLAYFINLYNAGTIALILEHYPVKSIRDIHRPWAKKRLQVGNDLFSLGDIEHKILRKMGDPRIHFAINCASVSCPRLPARAFTEEEVETQLHFAARAFINDPERNQITPQKAEVSKIFKWFRADFESPGVSLQAYLNIYSEQAVPLSTPIEFLSYDWSLNDSER